MGAFAAITIPLDLTRRGGAEVIALDIVETFPGTRNVSLDRAAGTIRFELHFPGNLGALARRLRSAKVPVGERAEVSVPIERLAPELLAGGPDHAAERMLEGTEVWDVQFERGRYIDRARINGDRVEATIQPNSMAMHQMYDTMLSLGLVASDGPHAVVHG